METAEETAIRVARWHLSSVIAEEGSGGQPLRVRRALRTLSEVMEREREIERRRRELRVLRRKLAVERERLALVGMMWVREEEICGRRKRKGKKRKLTQRDVDEMRMKFFGWAPSLERRPEGAGEDARK